MDDKTTDEWAKAAALGGDDALEALARQYGMEVRSDLSDMQFLSDLREKVPYSFAKANLILPIGETEEHVIAAVNDPLNLDSVEELRLRLGRPIQAVFARREVLLTAIQQCYNREAGAAGQILSELEEGGGRQGEVVEVFDLLDDRPDLPAVVRLLNHILVEAIQQGASDVHFEPRENDLRVRYRIDGVLQNRHSPAQEYQSQLLTRIKVMAQLDIAERRLPQDGRIKLRMGKREVDFRVSTVPTTNGERIVLRILDKGTVLLGLDSLGFPAGMLVWRNTRCAT